MHLLKYFHVLTGVTLLGFIIASYLYFISNKKDRQAIQRGLRLSLMIDAGLLLAIIFLFITGTHLVVTSGLSFTTPWIVMAYRLLGLVFFCWIILIIIKVINLRKNDDIFYGIKIFHTGHILMIILMIMIIHDAVMKTTLLR